MPPRTGKTSAIVLPPETWDTLKKVALVRALAGTAERGSVSEVIRALIDDAMPSLLAEIETHERGPKK
ncbi:hypothetical protein [Aureimonas phyllosphaerae]|uniref:Ribbon-helix-helix domain-containing protein n=1 Tax=Aureimonas phyllosphaerae TaxID=1166078 RepID=A0A7W6C0A8_9HYPH|nr:hypothetical protein [Aureimonas phyllosphaerae]MBB3938080.1 hypothetical protein [Aureimonas phyllosphaerae]MBB3962087.1 hypothetical protein [Aureimonas phyllosphaerae]SFF55802.1 hypothetical protein SAMN05216566_1283 [Aureimonas phyllosphaerae]